MTQDKTLNDYFLLEEEEEEEEDGEFAFDEEEDESSEENDDEEKVTLTKTELKEKLKAERKKQDERWKERNKNAKKEEKPAEKKPEEKNNEIIISRLEARGILEEDDQNFVLKYAKVEDITPIEALKHDFVKEKLASMKKKRDNAEATPSPSKRSNASKEKDVEYYVKNLNETPPTRELRKQVDERLRKKGTR